MYGASRTLGMIDFFNDIFQDINMLYLKKTKRYIKKFLYLELFRMLLISRLYYTEYAVVVSDTDS